MSKGIASADVPEIEVTPEMIEAGASEVASYNPEEMTSEAAAVEVFLAMWATHKKNLAKNMAAKDVARALGARPRDGFTA